MCGCVLSASRDFHDDRLVVLAGEGLLHVHEAAVRGAEEAGAVLGLATEPTNLGLQGGDDRATITREIGEHRRKTGTLRVLGSILEPLHAVEGRGDQSIEGGDVMFVVHVRRSEEHTSELQSLMRNSYAVFC